MNTITERHVQAIWYDAALRPDNLQTRSGNPVRVITPGEWNLEAGPDFTNAILELGDDHRRVTGDVEVHLCPADWELHGHGADPAYRNVIAHVTWRDGEEPKTLPPDAVTIWLGRYVLPDSTFSPDSIDIGAYPFGRLPVGERPCQAVVNGDRSAAAQLLTEAGKRRLKMKALRIAGRFSPGVSRQQVFYEEMMSALGYSKNVLAMRHVAERVPISELPKEKTAAQNALLTAGSFEEWNRGGVRPNNSPERRLELAAGLLTETAAMSLSDSNDFSPDATAAMVRELSSSGFIGKGRAAAMVANVIIPWAMAEGRLSEAPAWLPPEDVSQPIRRVAFRLFGRDHHPRACYANNGLQMQGLIHLYRIACMPNPDCSACTVPRRLTAFTRSRPTPQRDQATPVARPRATFSRRCRDVRH